MHLTTISTKGQVVIPAKIREETNLGPGDKIVFSNYKNVILIQKAETASTLRGVLQTSKRLSSQEEQSIIAHEVINKHSGGQL